MRVSISHLSVRKGFLFKKTYYEVQTQVAFSHEEKQIIRQRKLQTTKLLDRRPADARVDDRDEKFELRVGDFLDGKSDYFLCATPSRAKIYEEDILVVLERMKLWLSDNAEEGSSVTVEF
jgi:hypothetical protein